MDYTSKFLLAISSHLSSRRDCRNVEYVVSIGVYEESMMYQMTIADVTEGVHDKVYFAPERNVFPDIHHKKVGDETSVVNHVMFEHFRNTVFDHRDSCGNCRFKLGSLTPGVYVYAQSIKNNRRKWIKVR